MLRVNKKKVLKKEVKFFWKFLFQIFGMVNKRILENILEIWKLPNWILSKIIIIGMSTLPVDYIELVHKLIKIELHGLYLYSHNLV